MAGHRVNIGGQVFESKKDAVAYASNILFTAPIGPALDGQHDDLLRDLIELHPEAETKIGPGVDHFEIRRNNVDGSLAFFAVRVDGSAIDFSYRRCINGSTPSPKAQFRRACRQAILPHIKEERRRFFAEAVKPTCALTGEPITMATAEVDHAPPYTFERIVSSFVELAGIDDNDLRHVDKESAVIPTIANDVLRDRFIHFHNTFAKLRVISRNANQRLVPALVKAGEAH